MASYGKINKKIKTLGDLRALMKSLENIEDDYQISFWDFWDEFEVSACVDVSYSEKQISFNLERIN